MHRIDSSNLDGEVMFANDSDGLIEYDAPLALSPVKGNPLDRDNFYFADGGSTNVYLGADGGIFGFLSTPEGRKRRQTRREQRQKARLDAKAARSQAKLTDAEGRRLASEGLAKEDTSTAQLAAALGGDTASKARKAKDDSAGSNNTLYYVLGGIALLGVGFVIYKNMKKGK